MTNRQGYPDNSFNLTPDQVAGLVTGSYTYPEGSDLIDCGQTGQPACPLSPGPLNFPNCASTNIAQQCFSGLLATNPTPGFTAPQLYAAFVHADAAGTTDSLLSWVCTAPAPAITEPRVHIHLL